jgi:hypothetical protein
MCFAGDAGKLKGYRNWGVVVQVLPDAGAADSWTLQQHWWADCPSGENDMSGLHLSAVGKLYAPNDPVISKYAYYIGSRKNVEIARKVVGQAEKFSSQRQRCGFLFERGVGFSDSVGPLLWPRRWSIRKRWTLGGRACGGYLGERFVERLSGRLIERLIERLGERLAERLGERLGGRFGGRFA